VTFEEYQGRRVVVTGCSSGIGQAAAQALVGLGAEVHGVDLDAPTADLASYTPLDLADPRSITEAVGHIGPHVDALFNCAGATPMIPSSQIVKVNFLGTRLFTELVVDLMGPGGAIVNTSSDGGFGWRKKLPLLLEFVGIADFAAGAAWFEEHEEAAGHGYAFSKEALNVWTRQQSAVLIKRGVRVNSVSPGAVQTPMLEAIKAACPSELIDVTHEQIGVARRPRSRSARCCSSTVTAPPTSTVPTWRSTVASPPRSLLLGRPDGGLHGASARARPARRPASELPLPR
jgi:NAD(P)-dependent dehydrogenase (short-subunit alcohol dehydrogenase family)